MQVKNVKIDQIENIHNVRTNIGDVSSLMKSIKSSGLMQPIVLTKSSKKNKYKIVCGNRRLKALKGLNRKTIPANIVDVKDDIEFIVKNLIENTQRENVPVVDVGKSFLELQEMNLNYYEIAAKVSESPSYVKACIAIYDQVPKQYRSKITRKAKRGDSGIAMSIAKRIIDARHTFGLTKKQYEKLWEESIKHNLNLKEIDSLAVWIRNNPRAKVVGTNIAKIRNVKLNFSMKKNQIIRLEKKYDMNINEICKMILSGNIKENVKFS